MRYEVRIMPSARRGMCKLDRQAQARLLSAIDKLAEHPRPPGYRKLARPRRDLYRVRVGAYRIVYEIRDEVLTVLVFAMGHRRDICRELWR